MYFCCPRHFVEEPWLLSEALAAHEVAIKFDSSMLRGIGAVDLEPLGDSDRYEAFRFVLRTNRFRANLRVYDVDGMPLLECSPLVEQLMDVFSGLGIVPVHAPVEEELEFVESQFGGRADVAKVIAEIREKQRGIEQRVNDQAFEEAARLAGQRDSLLDQLYESCTA